MLIQCVTSLAAASWLLNMRRPISVSRFNELQMASPGALSQHCPTLELGRGRGISNLDKKARITRPAPLI